MNNQSSDMLLGSIFGQLLNHMNNGNVQGIPRNQPMRQPMHQSLDQSLNQLEYRTKHLVNPALVKVAVPVMVYNPTLVDVDPKLVHHSNGHVQNAILRECSINPAYLRHVVLGYSAMVHQTHPIWNILELTINGKVLSNRGYFGASTDWYMSNLCFAPERFAGQFMPTTNTSPITETLVYQGGQLINIDAEKNSFTVFNIVTGRDPLTDEELENAVGLFTGVPEHIFVVDKDRKVIGQVKTTNGCIEHPLVVLGIK